LEYAHSLSNELRATVEHIDEADGTVCPDQRVVGQLDHRQPTPLGGDRIQFAGGGLLALAQFVELARHVEWSTMGGRAFDMEFTFAIDLVL
jgi:hypothetical protein